METVSLNGGRMSSNIYWNMLKGLSSDIKLELISRLSASLVTPNEAKVETNVPWTIQLAGRWHDSRSTEDILSDIRESRTSNREIEL